MRPPLPRRRAARQHRRDAGTWAIRTSVGVAVVVATSAWGSRPAGAAPGPFASTVLGRTLSDDQKVLLVAGGLVAVALALTALTIRYWRVTRPVVPVAGDRSTDRSSHGQVPPVDASAATSDADASSPPIFDGDGAPPPSRRSVAGADHRSADEDWEPRGTGEQERVDVAPRVRSSRPGREARRTTLEGRDPS